MKEQAVTFSAVVEYIKTQEKNLPQKLNPIQKEHIKEKKEAIEKALNNLGLWATEIECLTDQLKKNPHGHQNLEAQLGQARQGWRLSFKRTLQAFNSWHDSPEPSEEESSQTETIPTNQASTSSSACQPKAQEAPHYKRVVLRGGGAKLHAYTGALPMLQEIGALNDLEHIAGTSAGALAASIVACGGDLGALITQPGLSNPMNAMGWHEDTAKKLKSEHGIEIQLKDCSSKSSLKPPLINRSALQLVHELDTILRASIKIMHAKIAEKFDTQQPTNSKQSGLVTFGELAELVENHPKHFRHLSIAARKVPNKTDKDQDTEKMIYFSSKNKAHHNIPIALAVRASSSLPVIMQHCIFKQGDTEYHLIDGATQSNLPLEAVLGVSHKEFLDIKTEKDWTFLEKLEETLAITFSDNGETWTKLHGTHEQQVQATREKTISKSISKNSNLSEDRLADAKKLEALGPNVMVLNYGNLALTSFNANRYEYIRASLEGEISAALFLAMRIGISQATYQTSKTPESQNASQSTSSLIPTSEQPPAAPTPSSVQYKWLYNFGEAFNLLKSRHRAIDG